jgi:hypothetical protein
MTDDLDPADKLGLTALGRSLLAQLRVARAPADLAAAGLTPDLIDALRQHGLIEPQAGTRQPADFADIFAGWKSQKGMLTDHIRTLAFRDAIEAVVKPGDTSIDVGTGTGILAMFAARAGAAASYGLELTRMADWAERLAADNGLSAVHVVRGDAATFRSPTPADLVMGEFAGIFLIEEWRHYAAFCAVRDANLAPGGAVLPRAATMYLSAIDSRRLYMDRGYGFWEAPVYGLDFSAARASDIGQPTRYVVTADKREIIDTQPLRSFDFATGTHRDFLFQTEVSFTYPGAGAFHGLIGHFDLDMGPGQTLSTSMAARETCWHQSYFPMPQIQVPAGGQVRLGVRSFIDPASEEIVLGLRVLAAPGTPAEAEAERVFALSAVA